MPKTGIEVRGLDQLVRKLGVPGFQTAIKGSLKTGGAHLAGKYAHYPSRRPKKVSQYWTAKQRRYFWWAKGKGIISVPYKRTGTLAKKWMVTTPNWYTAMIGNNADYARLVQSKADQSKYHQGNWDTIEAINDRELPWVVAQISRDLQSWLND